MAAGVCGPGLKPQGLLPGLLPAADTWDNAPIPSFCSRASGQRALNEVWIASPSIRSPAVGLRCSHTVVPGALFFL